MTKLNVILIIGVILIGVFVYVIKLISNHLNIIRDNNQTNNLLINFESYVAILTYHMTKAYDMIYKDRILIYSLEATKLDDEQFKIALKDFLILVKKFIGSTIEQELIKLYGSEETLLFTMTEYFNSKFENDEIRKDSMSDLMNTE